MAREARLVRLDDYVTGHMAESEALTFEEELFAAAETIDDEDVRFFDRAHALMEWITATGALTRGSTAEDVERLRASGVSVHVVEMRNDGQIEFEPWPDDAEIIVIRSFLDIREYEDVEVAVETGDGKPIKTFRGVQCDPATGNVYAICAAPLARMAYGEKRRISRFSGVRNGKREIIAVYDTTPKHSQ